MHGWDVAGVVEEGAAAGSGPIEGERVVGALCPRARGPSGGRCTARLAVLPDEGASRTPDAPAGAG